MNVKQILRFENVRSDFNRLYSSCICLFKLEKTCIKKGKFSCFLLFNAVFPQHKGSTDVSPSRKQPEHPSTRHAASITA